MELNDEEILKNKNEAISKINEYLDSCFLLDKKHKKKVNLLSYWLKDYIGYIEKEENFNCSKLKDYSRGDIIKANLCFNIGNEEGGLHYCIVLDKKNAKSYSTLTVVPLSSLKSSTKLNKTSVLLGNEIYTNLFTKNKTLISECDTKVTMLDQEISELEKLTENTEEDKIIKNYRITNIRKEINKIKEKLILAQKIDKELSQMKKGTIALINQITTISKQRIFNPKKDLDILSGLKLSDEKMKLIDEKIKKLYLN